MPGLIAALGYESGSTPAKAKGKGIMDVVDFVLLIVGILLEIQGV